jgi:hypothetical protein
MHGLPQKWLLLSYKRITQCCGVAPRPQYKITLDPPTCDYSRVSNQCHLNKNPSYITTGLNEYLAATHFSLAAYN